MNGAKLYGILGGCFGFLSVALGAFGAHGLKAILSVERMAVYQTAVQYQMYHSLVLLVVAIMLFYRESNSMNTCPWLSRAAKALIFGMLVFCGSLYILVLTGIGWLGAVTPIGGIAFLLAWLFVILAFLNMPIKNL